MPILRGGHPDFANSYRRAPRFCQSSVEGTQILPILSGGHPDFANSYRRAPRFYQSSEEGTQILPILRGGHPDFANPHRRHPDFADSWKGVHRFRHPKSKNHQHPIMFFEWSLSGSQKGNSVLGFVSVYYIREDWAICRDCPSQTPIQLLSNTLSINY